MELNQYEEKMKKSLANLEEEYGAIRAGRANQEFWIVFR